MGIMPNNRMLELMDKRDRPKGRTGMTAAEAGEREQLRLERQDQNEFRGWLERNQYAYYHSGTHKPTSANLGVPDFIVGCRVGLAIEFKRPGGKLSTEQIQWCERHRARGGLYHVVYNYAEAVAITEQINGG
jgi:VRR-NUC domain